MRSLLVVAAAALITAACGSDGGGTGGATVSGDVVVAEPGALDDADDAVLTVQLVDISLADAPAEVLDVEEIDLAGRTFPIPYELAYDPDEIDERNTYAVQARVDADGELLAINDTVTPAITNGAGTTGIEIVVIVVG